MIEQLFPAIKEAFHGNSDLLTYGREIFLGLTSEDDEQTLPYVNVAVIETNHEDTFGFDMSEIEVDFEVFTSSPTKYEASIIMRALDDVFRRDPDLPLTGDYSFVGSRLEDNEGPFIEDGQYNGRMTFKFWVQRKRVF